MTEATTAARHEPPPWAVVFSTQMRLLTALHRWLALALGAVGVLLLFGIIDETPPDLPRVFLAAPILTFAALFWAGVVWSDEGPSRRSYHWAMPVDRRTHDLTRVATGAVYLLAVFALYAAFGLVLAAFDGNFDSALRLQGIFWANLFIGPLILYLLPTVLVLLVDRPMLWLIGLSLALILALNVLDHPSLDLARRALASVFTGDYGLFVAIAGGYVSQTRVIADGAGAGESITLAQWSAAAALWIVLLCAACGLAASVRPERLAFLRRRRRRE
ncbi:MAG: hypothetical protein ACRELV_15575 [Longimicrobiales bacterium]